MGQIKVTKCPIEGLYIIEPAVHGDNRGYFMETYSQRDMAEAGLNMVFVQDNQSMSVKGVLRGLHFQAYPHEQAKIVRCIKGKIFDVAVDIRKNSPTFGKYVKVELSEDNKQMLYIPAGFAHGFVVLSQDAEIVYKTSAEYAPDFDRGLLWCDETVNIDWEIDFPILSEKDKKQPRIRELDL